MTISHSKALEMYNSIHPQIRGDLWEALNWARNTLTEKEGAGHQFSLTASGVNDGYLSCSFAKPQWAGDHSGSYMATDAEAIVMSVCEYLSGC